LLDGRGREQREEEREYEVRDLAPLNLNTKIAACAFIGKAK